MEGYEEGRSEEKMKRIKIMIEKNYSEDDILALGYTQKEIDDVKAEKKPALIKMLAMKDITIFQVHFEVQG